MRAPRSGQAEVRAGRGQASVQGEREARAGLEKWELQGRRASKRIRIMKSRTSEGQKPGPQEEGIPESRANIWQKFRLGVLNLCGSCIPLRMIKNFPAKDGS